MRSGIYFSPNPPFRFSQKHTRWAMLVCTYFGLFFALGASTKGRADLMVLTTIIVATVNITLFALGRILNKAERVRAVGMRWNSMSPAQRIQVFKVFAEKGIHGLKEAECQNKHHRLSGRTKRIILKHL